MNSPSNRLGASKAHICTELQKKKIPKTTFPCPEDPKYVHSSRPRDQFFQGFVTLIYKKRRRK